METEVVTITVIEEMLEQFASGKGVVTLDEEMSDKTILKQIRNALLRSKGTPFMVKHTEPFPEGLNDDVDTEALDLYLKESATQISIKEKQATVGMDVGGDGMVELGINGE